MNSNFFVSLSQTDATFSRRIKRDSSSRHISTARTPANSPYQSIANSIIRQLGSSRLSLPA